MITRPDKAMLPHDGDGARLEAAVDPPQQRWDLGRERIRGERALKDVLALVATAGWFAANIALWVMVPSLIGLFAWSVALGVLFFAGFFGYLSYRERSRSARPDKRAMLTVLGVLSWSTAAPAADLIGLASVVDSGAVAIPVRLDRDMLTMGACERANDPAFDCGRFARLDPPLEYPAPQLISRRSSRVGDWMNNGDETAHGPDGMLQ